MTIYPTKTCSKCKEEKSLDEFSKDGHNSICKTCVRVKNEKRREYNKKYYRDNIEKINATSKKWRAENSDRVRTCNKKWYAENPGYSKKWRAENPEAAEAKHKKYYTKNSKIIAARGKKWRTENPEAMRAINKKYKRNNPDRLAANNAQRHAAKLQRSPKWADKKAILEIYKQARALQEATGEPYHVDHIYPLQGETVSGLHVDYNLRAVPARVNLTKSNSFDPDA